MNSPLLSICIPAFERKEQLRNTLKSIYSQADIIGFSDFEVVVSENDNKKQLEILKDEFCYPNFKYFYTQCDGFLNSYYVLTYASGSLLLLHNSQELFIEGTLEYLITCVKKNESVKPLMSFTSGFLLNGTVRQYDNFNGFMENLSYWSSWSNAFSIWKEDFDKIKDNVLLNRLFPHTSLFITQFYKSSFLIIDNKLFETQFVSKRGGHNKFHAFSVEYQSILDEVRKKGVLSDVVYKKILNSIFYDYLPSLYFNVKIRGTENFDSVGFKDDLKKYYPNKSYYLIVLLAFLPPIRMLIRKLKRKLL